MMYHRCPTLVQAEVESHVVGEANVTHTHRPDTAEEKHNNIRLSIETLRSCAPPRARSTRQLRGCQMHGFRHMARDPPRVQRSTPLHNVSASGDALDCEAPAGHLRRAMLQVDRGSPASGAKPGARVARSFAPKSAFWARSRADRNIALALSWYSIGSAWAPCPQCTGTAVFVLARFQCTSVLIVQSQWSTGAVPVQYQ